MDGIIPGTILGTMADTAGDGLTMEAITDGPVPGIMEEIMGGATGPITTVAVALATPTAAGTIPREEGVPTMPLVKPGTQPAAADMQLQAPVRESGAQILAPAPTAEEGPARMAAPLATTRLTTAEDLMCTGEHPADHRTTHRNQVPAHA